MDERKYIDENKNNLIQFSNYFAKNLDKSIRFSEYLTNYRTKGEIIREQRKLKLNKIERNEN